ncbi:type 1 glutamine amidotransferase [Aureimonas sp. ME7]|uniref:type 1 glutamine amidotransferase n=1 Tax=Aureimonas sp. ME7 TaxID=2744252 RepID=UPI002453F0D6|nr:type 1 glutamine amidotransferase [Aureimonas sp. ME7]
MPPRFLIVASETPSQRDERRKRSGAASDESYAETLRAIRPDIEFRHVSCVDDPGSEPPFDASDIDAVFFAGSPIQMHAQTPETRSAAAFMTRIMEAGLLVFGSCAGLQIATVAAGGRVRPRGPMMEAAFSRGIVATKDGAGHPLLEGRPLTWDALTMHSDEVESLPANALLLASSNTTPVQAVEIRLGEGVFWGVQYHPELSLAEIASSLRGQADDLEEQGLARDEGSVAAYAERIETLSVAPGRRDLAWQLGVGDEVVDDVRRTNELRNFIRMSGFSC